MKVVYITDSEYVTPTYVSLMSLKKHRGMKHTDVCVISADINEDDINRIEELCCDDFSVRVICASIEEHRPVAQTCLSKDIHVSAASMLKFELDTIFPEDNVILYLDSDTLISGDISELYNINLKDNYVAAVRDMGDMYTEKNRSFLASRIGLDSATYFNSGVMLLNLSKIREDNIAGRLREYRANGINYFMDQDAYNHVMSHRVIWLDETYNFRAPILEEIGFEKTNEIFFSNKYHDPEEMLRDQKIIHMSDRFKPWKYYTRWFSDMFIKYYNMSPYRDVPLKLESTLGLYYKARDDRNVIRDKMKYQAKKCGIWSFWNLIEQEAYLPESEYLKGRGMERFRGSEAGKNVWLFGCNGASESFIYTYSDTVKIAGILDNSTVRQGSDFHGIWVYSPEEAVCRMREETDTVIICMRISADTIAQQLDCLGFRNYYSLGVLIAGEEPYRSFIEELDEIKKRPLEDIVMLESTNDCDGNAGAVYEYLKKRGSTHTFAWVLKNPDNRRLVHEGNIALCPSENVEELKKYLRIRAVAKWELWDNSPVRKVRDDQINVFLQHYGMGYKKIAKFYGPPKYADYILTTTKLGYGMDPDSLTYFDEKRMIYGELPRNDVLFSDEWHELEKLTNRRYSKVVMWAPTLRESAENGRLDSDIEYPFGISVIYTDADMQRLDAWLNDKNMLLMIKLHPRQKLRHGFDNTDNVMFLDGGSVKKVHAYKLMTQMDAMISDYSSIVFDYMLLDRPIAFALEDREHYRISFLMDDPNAFMPGEKIFGFDDLIHFLENVYNGADTFAEERRALSAKYNAPPEGRGCEKLVKYLGL